MKVWKKVIVAICLALFSSCASNEPEQESLLIFPANFDFSESDQEWSHGFAEYPSNPDDTASFELRYAYTEGPADLKLTKRSVMLSGNNLNKDLFMYIKRKVTGLRPETDYTVTFSVDLASAFTRTLAASGGGVYLKAGATAFEPKTVEDEGYFVMNVDKGEEGTSGQHMVSLGNLVTAESSGGYTLFSRNNTMANSRYVAKTNAKGELWLIVGTDSSLQGTNTVFYNRINVVFSAS